MLKENEMKPVEVWRIGVLILILMEHAQRGLSTWSKTKESYMS